MYMCTHISLSLSIYIYIYIYIHIYIYIYMYIYRERERTSSMCWVLDARAGSLRVFVISDLTTCYDYIVTN